MNIKEIKYDDEISKLIFYLLCENSFDDFEIKSLRFFKYKATKNFTVIKDIYSFLYSINCNLSLIELEKFNEDDDVLILSVDMINKKYGYKRCGTKGILFKEIKEKTETIINSFYER